MDLQTLLAAIRQIESNGRYSVVNSIGALGAYQIMRGNLASWSRQALGRTVSEREFLNNPAIQDQIAGFILGGYLKKYGAEGAAAMWFSGQPNPNSRASDGGNTVRQYVNKVMSAAGSGGVMQHTLTPVSAKAKAATPGYVDPTILARDYGFTSAMLNAIPELNTIFQNAVRGGWDAKKFQAAVENSTWWKTHNKSQRDYLIKYYTDPASWQRDRDQMSFKINDMAAQIGVTDLMGTKDMTDLIWNMLYNGWSDAQLKYHLADLVQMSPEGVIGGQGGQFQNQMAQLAWSNGVRVNQDWYLHWYRSILQGNASAEEAQRWIRNQAAAIFPSFREQIVAGMNVIDIANPYIQSMGNILELDSGSLDLFDPGIVGALNWRDAKTGYVGAKPLWLWETDLRKDPRWLKTNNAREGLFTVAHKVAQDFGVMS